MSARFRGLRETLLRAGIAPRHVRRYLRELDEHLNDLVADQLAMGYEGEDAMIRARARLGGDAELAQAMIDQRDFRSISARFPWAVFPLLPLPAVFIGLALSLLLTIGLSKLVGFGIGGTQFAVPAWYSLLAGLLLSVVNFLMMPLVTLLLTILVWRQRLSILWLLPCLLILLPLITDLQGDFFTAADLLQHKRDNTHIGLGWTWAGWGTGSGQNWGILPGKLATELQMGVYSGLARQLLILLPPMTLIAMRLRQRKAEADAV
jgi:hypothetical protein